MYPFDCLIRIKDLLSNKDIPSKQRWKIFHETYRECLLTKKSIQYIKNTLKDPTDYEYSCHNDMRSYILPHIIHTQFKSNWKWLQAVLGEIRYHLDN